MKFNIEIKIEDFPVSKSHIDSVSKIGTVLSVSKWANCVIVGVNDSTKINTLATTTFVTSTKYIGSNNLQLVKSSKTLEPSIDYGLSIDGIKQMNGDYLHSQGYDGDSTLIAVLDAGFINVNNMADFNHLYSNNKIIAVKNFVLRNENVYSMDNHGTNVLSVLAAKNEGNIYCY